MSAELRTPAEFRSVTADASPRIAMERPQRRLSDNAPFWVAFIEYFSVAAAAYAASVAYTFAYFGTFQISDQYILAANAIAALVVLTAMAMRQYTNIPQQPRHRFLWSGLATVTLAFSFFLSIIFLSKFSDEYSRATFFMQFVGVCIATLSTRTFSYAQLQSRNYAGSSDAMRIILIGDAPEEVHNNGNLAELRRKAVGSFAFPDIDHNEYADKRHAFVEACRRLHPDYIVILAQPHELPRVSNVANTLAEIPVSTFLIPVGVENLVGSATIAEINGMATLQLLHPPLTALDLFMKDVIDRVCAALGLIVLAPLLITAAIAIKLDSRGPVIFRQTRHGFNNRIIQVFKFRTMNVVEDGNHFTQATKYDPRVTRVGRILRRTNIDEIPQLLNVLLGEMSIVGPRPHATAQNESFEKLLAGFSRRHIVKPGITGWAQINGYRGEADTLDKMRRRVEYDLYYIDNWSLLFDLKIIILTLLSKRAYSNAY